MVKYTVVKPVTDALAVVAEVARVAAFGLSKRV